MDNQTYIESAINQFKEYKALADKTFAQLTDDNFIYTPNENYNSISIIIAHMHGNMLSRWTNFLTEDGEKEWRKRDKEFEVQKLSKAGLLKLWEDGWDLLFETLSSLTIADLNKTIFVRKEPLNVVDAINRQLTHYASHVGQIIYIGKIILNDKWKTLSIPKKQSKTYY